MCHLRVQGWIALGFIMVAPGCGGAGNVSPRTPETAPAVTANSSAVRYVPQRGVPKGVHRPSSGTTDWDSFGFDLNGRATIRSSRRSARTTSAACKSCGASTWAMEWFTSPSWHTGVRKRTGDKHSVWRIGQRVDDVRDQRKDRRYRVADGRSQSGYSCRKLTILDRRDAGDRSRKESVVLRRRS